MERKRKIIIVLILIILFILLLFFVILLKNIITINSNKAKIIEEEKVSLEILKDNSIFYTISNKVNKYLIDIANKDTESLYWQLDSLFINQNNITKDNILSFIDNYGIRKSFSMEKAQYITKNNINVYIVSGKIKTDSINMIQDEDEYCLIVKLDMKNMTYSIYPLKGSINEVNVNKLVELANSIDKNNVNSFNLSVVNNMQIAKGYLVIYKKYANSEPEKAYNMLDKKYRDKRFGSLDKYKEYLNKMKKNNINQDIEEYAVNVYDDYKEYVCKDNYGYYWIFKETSPVHFTVLLDSYTVTLKDTINKYKQSTDEQKASMHVQSFVEMINTKDYTTAYKILAQGYKDNYLKSEEMFIKFIQYTFFECNIIENVSLEKRGDYYVIQTTIKDYKNSNKTKKVNFIVNLKDDMQFELSFGS